MKRFLERTFRFWVIVALLLAFWAHGGFGQSLFLQDAPRDENGWYRVSWFGHVYTEPELEPWHYDTNLGWIYVVPGPGEDFWMYADATQSWLYTRADLYPYAYDASNGWLFLNLGGGDTWFYAYDTLDWIHLAVPPMNRPFDKRVSMARFLDQATLGVSMPELEAFCETDVESWIEEQFAMPFAPLAPRVETLRDRFGGDEGLDILFHSAWWGNVMAGDDLLRQRVVLALSEIIVVSDLPSEISLRPEGMASWYDMLQEHAFGNFRDLLYAVTLHPVMGYYLSHAGNRPPDTELNRFPDENYAREIMQLFTIGLYELNPDGTRRLDGAGNPIPTYTNAEITEFARVFTGLIYDWTPLLDEFPALGENDELFDILIQHEFINFEEPMVMVEREHDPEEKRLLYGEVLPEGQSGLEDINAALDNLFHHPNVGPFIGRLLIQRLVKSNPSPGYVERVAEAFNDNGEGVRGDMQAVIRAILVDQEARNLYHMEDPAQGKMREPFFRFIKLLRAMDATDYYGEYLMADGWIGSRLGQRPFSSPSVFNFFLPDHQPIGPIADAGLVAPEFQITNAQTIPDTINFFSGVLWRGLSPREDFEPDLVNEEGEPIPEFQRLHWENPWFFDTSGLEPLLEDPAALVDHLDLLLANGSLSERTREIVIEAIEPLGAGDGDYGSRAMLAMHLILLSPEFTITK